MTTPQPQIPNPSNIADGQTVRWNALQGRFIPADFPVAGGSPLSTVLFADVGTTVPVADQTGSIATPFGTLQGAVDVNPAGGTIMIAPGNYGAGITLAAAAQFSGMAAQGSTSPVTVGGITLDAGISAWFENMTVTFAAGNGAALRFLNCVLDGTFTNTGTLVARLSSIGVITAGDGTAVANITLIESDITGNITTGGALVIRNATSFSAVTLTAATIDIDSESFRRAVFAGVTFVGTVSGFSGSNLTWGRNSGLVVGNFPNPGIGRQNYTGANVGTESQGQVFASHRGVLCFLIANSGANLKFTLRINGVDTALTVTVNNSTVRDTTHFVEVQAGDLISLQAQNGGDPIASGSALASAVYV